MKGITLTVPGQQGETRWGVSLVVSESVDDTITAVRALADLVRKAKPAQNRSLLAQALTTAYWLASVDVLVQVRSARLPSLSSRTNI